MIYDLQHLLETAKNTSTPINERYVPARPENYKYESWMTRFEKALAVFSGKADAMYWPGEQQQQPDVKTWHYIVILMLYVALDTLSYIFVSVMSKLLN